MAAPASTINKPDKPGTQKTIKQISSVTGLWPCQKTETSRTHSSSFLVHLVLFWFGTPFHRFDNPQGYNSETTVRQRWIFGDGWGVGHMYIYIYTKICFCIYIYICIVCFVLSLALKDMCIYICTIMYRCTTCSLSSYPFPLPKCRLYTAVH